MHSHTCINSYIYSDPITMSELRFTFKPQDFKCDIVLMAKKKNPQKVVDSINCKLTRLQKWRDILVQEEGNAIDNNVCNAI